MVAYNSNISTGCLGSSVHFSTKHQAITQGVAKQHSRLKFAKIKTNMVARGLLHKTLFPPSLVSSLCYQLFLVQKTSILQAITREKKHFFKPLCWNINKNCDIDVQIDCAGYPTTKKQEKINSSGCCFNWFFLLDQSHLWISSSTAHATNNNRKNTICVYSCGIVGLTDQRTTFVCAQRATLQKSRF